MGEPVKNGNYYLNIKKQAEAEVLAAIKRKDHDASSKAAEAAIQAEDNARNAEKKQKLEKLKSQYDQQTALMLSYARKCKNGYVNNIRQSLEQTINKSDVTYEKSTMLLNLEKYIRTSITPILKGCQNRPKSRHTPYIAPPSGGGRRTRRVKRGRKGTRRQRGGNPKGLVCAKLAVCLESQYEEGAKGDEVKEEEAENNSIAAMKLCLKGTLTDAENNLKLCEKAAAKREEQLVNFLKARMHSRHRA